MNHSKPRLISVGGSIKNSPVETALRGSELDGWRRPGGGGGSKNGGQEPRRDRRDTGGFFVFDVKTGKLGEVTD